MKCYCKDFVYILTLTLPLILTACPQPKPKEEVKITPIKDKQLLLENSSSIFGLGPIPEWVLDIESSREIQKTKNGVFFVVFLEGSEVRSIQPEKEFEEYLSNYLPDGKKISSILNLKVSGKYWHKTKEQKYQTFHRYEITRESIENAIKRKNEFSEKTRSFLDQLN
ncbi:MAG: hypothetical protein RMJ37_03305 [Spirochaetia bacterium]|nr:hypothetical protein [Spirochaetota bacterium]MCX8096690.1 hypothetical protein [Spirochaetota bacterium]MDW8112354.1 hypothetical protein [Spirochaetia bacterium]